MNDSTPATPTEKLSEIIGVIETWTREAEPGAETDRLREWLDRRTRGQEAEPLIEMFNWIGRQENLRPLGLSLQDIMRGMRLCDLVNIAGRRMIFLLVGIVMARLNNTTLKQNILDPELAAQSLARTTEFLETEYAFSSVPDISAFAESYGCEVKILEDAVPIVTKHSVADLDDLVRLEQSGPQWHDRLMNSFAVLESMTKQFTVFNLVLGGGPFSMAGILHGVEELCRKTIKDPAFVERILEFCTNISIMAAQMLVSAGADIIYLGDPTGGLLSRDHYERYAAPYIKRVAESVDVPTVLHICGRTTHIIEPMCATGVQGISLDSMVDMPSIVSRVPSDVVIIGNLDPVGPLLTGTAEQTAAATTALLDSMRDVPNYMFSAGCEVALETPPENIRAMVDTVKNYR
jgi:uroporphyrinogen decarboxylase